MGNRSFFASALVLSVGLLGAAHADPKADIQAKSKEAMENYDLMDYDAAKKQLKDALAIAKKAKLDKDPTVARVYVDIAIAAFANSDQEGAKSAFASAVAIDPKIQIDAAYKSPELTKLLEAARASAGGGAGTTAVEPADSSVDCSKVKGLDHTLIDTAKGNAALLVDAALGAEVKADKVSLMFRPEGSTDFVEVKMTKAGCKYTAKIPASAMHGSLIHYYIAAYDANNKVVVAKGSAGSPNIMELTGGGGPAVKNDDENPLGGGGTKTAAVVTGPADVTDTTTVTGPAKPTKFFIAVSGGTGAGYVSGTTETGNSVQTCCISNPIVVIAPELGIYVNPQLSIGLVARLGLPLGANVDPPNGAHATVAPAALVRVRYGLAASGEGLRVTGEIGAGILRNTIKLNDATAGMDTDIVAQGPLLIGGGIGYIKKLNAHVAFVADFLALAGIAVTDHLGSAPKLNSGLSADLSLGLALGF